MLFFGDGFIGMLISSHVSARVRFMLVPIVSYPSALFVVCLVYRWLLTSRFWTVCRILGMFLLFLRSFYRCLSFVSLSLLPTSCLFASFNFLFRFVELPLSGSVKYAVISMLLFSPAGLCVTCSVLSAMSVILVLCRLRSWHILLRYVVWLLPSLGCPQFFDVPLWRYCRVSLQCTVIMFIHYRRIKQKVLAVTLQIEST